MLTGKRDGYREISNVGENQVILCDQDDIHISGYKESAAKKWIFIILSIVLCGVPTLFLYWYPQLIHLKCKKSCLSKCDKILIKDANNVYYVCSVRKVEISLKKTSKKFQKLLHSTLKIKNGFRYFCHKNIKYIWLNNVMQFQQLRGWDGGIKKIKDLEACTGYTIEEQNILLEIYGKNEIKISTPGTWQIVSQELFQPFYLFQIFSIILWLFNDYLSYAICVILFTSCSIFFCLFDTKKQRKSLQNLAHKSVGKKINVVRKDGLVEEIDTFKIVPGDIIQIPRSGCVMACDALLLNGHCIVNENSLTGESSPVTKTPPTNRNESFNSIISKRHVLFCGTEVLQTRYYGEKVVTAVVINTGFSTVKGELIRCLLHPKPLGFKFHEDSVRFVFSLAFIAICGIFYHCYISLSRNTPLKELLLDSLDLITIVVPPALPAALTAGIAYSRSRLLSKGIHCISAPKINVFGKLKLMCFDKTGTLTDEGLDLWGVLPSMGKEFGTLIQCPEILKPNHPLAVALATCHSLTKINGKICGDPLDLSMFNSLNWELDEPGGDTTRYDVLCPTTVRPKNQFKSSLDESINTYPTSSSSQSIYEAIDFCGFEIPYEIGIVREFSFTSAKRCMSVITRRLGSSHMNIYCKGAPEKIKELCEADSVPKNFNTELQTYASMGFRVLGIAYKEFDHKFTWRKSQRVRREEVEKGLTFLGLIIMQNKLKQVTTGVLTDLRTANIRCVMVTGDNLLTALSVSRECLMVLPEETVMEVKVTPPGESDDTPVLTFNPIEGNPYFNKNSKLKENQFVVQIQSPRRHYAMDGKTWELLRTYYPDLIPKIIVRGTVFARMLPEQKTQLVEAFQDLDYVVGMCGDGANDYGAMKAAHVGVALSETESSIIAPFTSKVQDVSCIVDLVQEGRCALISTFVIFKYMTVYSLIQFISVLMVYEKGVCFGNVEFLYVDLVVTSLLAVIIGRTGPSKRLVKSRPIARLISFNNLFPLCLQVIVLFFTQYLALKFLYKQSWFVPVVPSPEAVTVSWENTVVYCTSLFQYLILALVYSKGKPYRQPFYKNSLFSIVFMLMTIFAVLLCVWPFTLLANFFEIIPVEKDNRLQTIFRLELLLLPLLNLTLSFLIEISMNDQKWLKNIIHFVIRKKESKNFYKRLLIDPDSQFC